VIVICADAQVGDDVALIIESDSRVLLGASSGSKSVRRCRGCVTRLVAAEASRFP
jgi:hypothetical protein